MYVFDFFSGKKTLPKMNCLCILAATAIVINCVGGQLIFSPHNQTDSLSLISSVMNGQSQILPSQRDTYEAVRQISSASEQFSAEFLTLLSKAVSGQNYDFIVSPFSIWSLLVLQAEGAAGNTFEQLRTVLRLPNDLSYLRMGYKHVQEALQVNTSTVEVLATQAMFTDENRPVDHDFAYKLEYNYNADHIPVNFQNAAATYSKINQYVRDQTRGKIEKIVNMDDLKEAQMLMISAIYFKGQWKV